MANFFKNLKKYSENFNFVYKTLPTIVIIIITLFTRLSKIITKSLDVFIITNWLLILSGVVISCILFIISLYKKNKKNIIKNKKYFDYDVLWTLNADPLCPSCKKHLIRGDYNDYTLECPDEKCGFIRELKDENNKRISVKDAKIKIKEHRTC